jgi:hypothetical protein
MHILLHSGIRHHEWEKTEKSNSGMQGVIRLWKCARCGFSHWAEEGDEPSVFELTYNEWDCDLQLAQQIMES